MLVIKKSANCILAFLVLIILSGNKAIAADRSDLQRLLYQESIVNSSVENPIPILNSLSFFIEANLNSYAHIDQPNHVKDYLKIKSVESSIERFKSLHPKIGLGLKVGRNINASFGFDTSEISKKIMLLGTNASATEITLALTSDKDFLYNFAGVMYDSYENVGDLKQFHSLHQIYLSAGGIAPNPTASPSEYAKFDVGTFWKIFMHYDDNPNHSKNWDLIEGRLENFLKAQNDEKVIQNLKLCETSSDTDCAIQIKKNDETLSKFNQYFAKHLEKQKIYRATRPKHIETIQELNSFFASGSRLANTLKMEEQATHLSAAGYFTEAMINLDKASSAYEIGDFINASTFSLNSLNALFSIGSVLESKKSNNVLSIIYRQNLEILQKLDVLNEKVDAVLNTLTRLETQQNENFTTLLNSIQNNTKLLNTLNAKNRSQTLILGRKISDIEHGAIQTSLKKLEKIALANSLNVESKTNWFKKIFRKKNARNDTLSNDLNQEILANMGEIEGLLLRLQRAQSLNQNRLSKNIAENRALIEAITGYSNSGTEFVPYMDQVTFVEVLEEYLDVVLKLPPVYLSLVDISGIEEQSKRYKNQIKEIQNLTHHSQLTMNELVFNLKADTDAIVLNIINNHRGIFRESMEGELTDLDILELIEKGLFESNIITNLYSYCLINSVEKSKCNAAHLQQMPNELNEHSFLRSFGILNTHKDREIVNWFWSELESDPYVFKGDQLCVPYRHYTQWGPAVQTKYSGLIKNKSFTWNHYTTCMRQKYSKSVKSLRKIRISKKAKLKHVNNVLPTFLYSIVNFDQDNKQSHAIKKIDKLKISSKQDAVVILSKITNDIKKSVQNELWNYNTTNLNNADSILSNLESLIELQKYSNQFRCSKSPVSLSKAFGNASNVDKFLNNMKTKSSTISFLKEIKAFEKQVRNAPTAAKSKSDELYENCNNFGNEISLIDKYSTLIKKYSD